MEFWGSIIRKKISMLWTHTFLHHLCPSLATELQMKLVGCPFSPTKIVPLFAPGGLRISSESVWWLSTIASRHTLSSSSSSVEYSSVCAPSGGDIEVECQSGKKKKKDKSLSNSILSWSSRCTLCLSCRHRLWLTSREELLPPTRTFFPPWKGWGPDCLYLHPCTVSPLLVASLLSEMHYFWENSEYLHTHMLTECALAHVSLVSAFFMAASEDRSSSGSLPAWIYGGRGCL